MNPEFVRAVGWLLIAGATHAEGGTRMAIVCSIIGALNVYVALHK